MSSRNVSSERRAKPAIERKRSASTGTSSRKIRSTKDGEPVKSCATKSRGIRERRLLSPKGNEKGAKVPDDARHKGRLSDEASVASGAVNNEPIYILRKEIHDWRTSRRLTDGFESEHRVIEEGTKKSFVRDNCNEAVAKDIPKPDILPESPSSILVDRLTRRT